MVIAANERTHKRTNERTNDAAKYSSNVDTMIRSVQIPSTSSDLSDQMFLFLRVHSHIYMYCNSMQER